ncbi:hypothetical protein MG293_016098 [Ovis ammon polii]|uniref:Uncharacterized protein n=1 Tax=Ovis ammon polii TaxID=230172 RepID=A0AAD4Y2X6_OVIAM|nr:hypothetical protein MG293_016098 [Ovis ammon polii]
MEAARSMYPQPLTQNSCLPMDMRNTSSTFQEFSPSFRDCVGNVDIGRKQLSINTLGTKSFLDKITPSPSEIVALPGCELALLLRWHLLSVDQDNSSMWPSAIPVVLVVGIPSKSVPGKHI